MAADAADRRTALITGLTGQDGSFMAEILLEKVYAVTGMFRGSPGHYLELSRVQSETILSEEGRVLLWYRGRL